MPGPDFDVIVPSFRRPRSLAACLAGLARQQERPRGVLVVARVDDTTTAEVARAAADIPVTVVPVAEPGFLHTLHAGVAATTASSVAFTDDDAVAPPDWLAALGRMLAEPGVGGAGGRDLVPDQGERRQRTVGVLRPWGRYHGAHHLGQGPPRDVHVLKGVNMAYRADALALPRPGALRGSGMQYHTEELIGAWARARGWRLRYDPAVTVEHRIDLADEERAGMPAPDPRSVRAAWFDGAYNRTVGTIATDPDHATIHTGYGLLVGAREAPGLVHAGVAAFRGEGDVVRRLGPSLSAQWSALRHTGDGRDLMVSCSTLRRGRAA